jgi:addiction module RelE/StbE family toxin
LKIYNIKYSPEAKGDLRKIKLYIKNNLHEPDIAERLIKKIKESVRELKTNPEMYAVVDINRKSGIKIRRLMVDNYRVFYRVKGDWIQVIRILYKKRNWIKIIW